MKKHRLWKKNLLRVPDALNAKLRTFKKKDVIAAAVKKIVLSDIKARRYAQVGIKLRDGQPVFEASVVPSPSSGRYSAWNVEGREVVRKDLPMVMRTYSWETPNYGDWSLGSHTSSIDRPVYQRDYLPPPELSMSVDLIGQEEGHEEPVFVFKFAVDEVLRPGQRGFGQDLLFALNLLQENVGVADVFAAGATREDYLKTIYVHWEILPPGKRNETIARILAGIKGATPEIRRRLADRYDLLSGLEPMAYISGTSGFRRYFGAQFADDFVVFENLEYGNAVYAMFERWQDLRACQEITD